MHIELQLLIGQVLNSEWRVDRQYLHVETVASAYDAVIAIS